jgi:hypothetical protein
MKINQLKRTLAGVTCEKTRAMVKELRWRGFEIGLENAGGNGNQYRIVTFINGYYFAISMVNSVFCKNYTRGKHKWQKFTDIDDLVRASCLKEKTGPSKKQLEFISVLTTQLGIDDYENPETVGEAIEMIDQLKQLRQKQKYNIRPYDSEKRPGNQLPDYRKSTDVKMVRTR